MNVTIFDSGELQQKVYGQKIAKRADLMISMLSTCMNITTPYDSFQFATCFKRLRKNP